MLSQLPNCIRNNVFVAYCVRQILAVTGAHSWRFCPTEDNRANLLTRASLPHSSSTVIYIVEQCHLTPVGLPGSFLLPLNYKHWPLLQWLPSQCHQILQVYNVSSICHTIAYSQSCCQLQSAHSGLVSIVGNNARTDSQAP